MFAREETGPYKYVLMLFLFYLHGEVISWLHHKEELEKTDHLCIDIDIDKFLAIPHDRMPNLQEFFDVDLELEDIKSRKFALTI